jgi:pyridoxal phosphate biosynthesis protein PdxJ
MIAPAVQRRQRATNSPAYAKAIKGLQEVSIGHALIADALYTGMTRSVKTYLKTLDSEPLAATRQRAKRQRAKGQR